MMDRKSIIILVISFIVLMTWPMLMNQIWPPKPIPPSTNVVSRVTNQVAETTNVPVAPAPATNVPSPQLLPPLPVPSGTQEKVEVVTNENARYVFSSFGGGLKAVELVKYPEVVACRGSKASDNLATLNSPAPAPVLSIRAPMLEEDGVFSLRRIPGGMQAEKQLSNGVYLVKEFKPSTNYLIDATVRLENRSNQNLTLPRQVWMAGTATPLKQQDSSQLLGVFWYDGKEQTEIGASWFANHLLGCACPIFPSNPRSLYEAGNNNVHWTAVHNQFFALAVIPKEPGAKVMITEVELPQPPTNTASGKAPPKVMGLQAGLIYPETTLAPNQKIEKSFSIYAGPKEYRTLQDLGVAFKNKLDLVMGYGGFWGFFAKVLLLSMNGLHSFGLSYAWAIICITIIIKAVFWPLTQASTRSMKRMQALQPQMNALREKYKDDPGKMNRKMMEFMKEHKVNPMGGCWPMLIQIPIFFGFYRMIQNAIELRGASFLWVCDLSQPDTLFYIPGLNFPFNPLPLLMGVTMLWQARLTPPSPGMDPMQQKLMKYMPLFFLFILYNFSAGLTLYWTVQNLLTILQMKLTRTQTDDAAGKVAPPGPKK